MKESIINQEKTLLILYVAHDGGINLGPSKIEIKMEPLIKAVYLLFLQHPEGIVFKCLPDYRKELTNIYSSLRPLGLTRKAIQSIEDVTNPLHNSINEKCARIKSILIKTLGNDMASHYFIKGMRGKEMKIDLPRELVVWE